MVLPNKIEVLETDPISRGQQQDNDDDKNPLYLNSMLWANNSMQVSESGY